MNHEPASGLSENNIDEFIPLDSSYFAEHSDNNVEYGCLTTVVRHVAAPLHLLSSSDGRRIAFIAVARGKHGR